MHVCVSWAHRMFVWLSRLLLGWGARPNTADDRGVTPLHLAAAARSLPLVRLLLKAEGDPLITDAAGASPAGWARVGACCTHAAAE